MNIEVSKDNICINKLVAEKKELIFVEDDVIVPDTKPDILSTVNVTGNVCVNKKEVMEDKVKIDGNINTYIMYLPDSKEDNLRALNTSISFSHQFNIQGAKEDMLLSISTCIKDMECKVLNGRKVSIKAGIEFTIKLYSNEDVEIIKEVKNVDDIQVLQKEILSNSLIGHGTTTVYAKETVGLDQKDELAEILKADINLVDNDIKLSYNKVLAKSEAEIKILYLTEDNRINSVNAKIPVVGFIDMPNISDENICDVNYEIKNIIIKPNSAEEHSIYIELEIEPLCMAYEKKKINLIQDIYSPTTNLSFTQRKISTIASKTENTKNFTIKNKTQISELQSGSLLNVDVRPVISNTQITKSKIVYTGDINLNFIFENGNNVNSRISKIPFEVGVENTEGTDNINVDTEIKINSTNFDIESSDVNCEIDMEVISKISRTANINIIDNIEETDPTENSDEDYNSLILYIVQPNDTLWNLAKKFNSTVSEITRMNGIEDESKIFVGQKLYIPKFRYIRKEINQNARPQTIM